MPCQRTKPTEEKNTKPNEGGRKARQASRLVDFTSPAFAGSVTELLAVPSPKKLSGHAPQLHYLTVKPTNSLLTPMLLAFCPFAYCLPITIAIPPQFTTYTYSR